MGKGEAMGGGGRTGTGEEVGADGGRTGTGEEVGPRLLDKWWVPRLSG